MRIYSDFLTVADLYNTARETDGLFIEEVTPIPRPRVKSKGWILRISGDTRRRKNSGIYGAESTRAASHDQHGEWFGLLYNIDPDARVCNYSSRADFHRQTNHKYEAKPCSLCSTSTR